MKYLLARKSELSMIEVARAILELRGRDHEMHFSDLVNEIKTTWNIKQRYPRSLPCSTELNLTVASSHLETTNGVFTEKTTTQSSTETSQKASTETTYPLTVKTYIAKGNEVEQVFDKARYHQQSFQPLKSY